MDISKAEKLKQHFSTRVTHQARAVLDLWRCLHDDEWQQARLKDLHAACDKLLSFAERFEAQEHVAVARKLEQTLAELEKDKSPSSDQLSLLNQLMTQLSQTAVRGTDSSEQAGSAIKVKKPVYLALNDSQRSVTLAQQMEYFGLRPELFSTVVDFKDGIHKRLPMAIIMDLDFCEPDMGLQLVNEAQQLANGHIPIIYYSSSDISMELRLRCIRTGGIKIMQELIAQPMINLLEGLVQVVPEKPFRIMVVDDSKSQALFTEKALNAAGMITQAVTDPMLVMDALQSFQPEMVLMDMYMPGCTGVELAKLIRQDEHYLNMPIIYLSGEEDKERQLAAMAEGGDDFLTKPVDPRHLLSTVRNRGKRARELRELIVSDSLTGLYNHTHIQKALDEKIELAKQQDLPLSFIMLDIDHFKQVNDNYGHPMGDEVIKNLALFLSQRLRKTDDIGRYGGEEFAIVMPNTSLENAMLVMDEIRANFSRLIHGADSDLQVSFSCGVAAYKGQPGDQLIEQADKALYEAKKAGRNCVKASDNHSSGQ